MKRKKPKLRKPNRKKMPKYEERGVCMDLPNDPFILFSYVNTQLRDTGVTLAEFCSEHAVDEAALREKLAAAGFRYDEAQNRFR